MIRNQIPKPYRIPIIYILLDLSLLVFFMAPACTLRLGFNGTIAGYSVWRLYWTALALGVVGSLLLTAHAQRRFERFRKVLSGTLAHGGCLCWSCGYDIRGHGNDASCPECGFSVTESRQKCKRWLGKGYLRRWWWPAGTVLDAVWASWAMMFLMCLFATVWMERSMNDSLMESERSVAKEHADFNAWLVSVGQSALTDTLKEESSKAAEEEALFSHSTSRSFRLVMALLLGAVVVGRAGSWWLASRIERRFRASLANNAFHCWYCGFTLRTHDSEAPCPACGYTVGETQEKYSRWSNRPLWRRIILT